jgi:hypothetical protein
MAVKQQRQHPIDVKHGVASRCSFAIKDCPWKPAAINASTLKLPFPRSVTDRRSDWSQTPLHQRRSTNPFGERLRLSSLK